MIIALLYQLLQAREIHLLQLALLTHLAAALHVDEQWGYRNQYTFLQNLTFLQGEAITYCELNIN